MNKKIKIPLIYISNNFTFYASIIYNNIKCNLNKLKIPYIIFLENKYLLIYNNKEYLLKNISEVVYFCSSIIIIEASYKDKYIQNIVNLFLDKGLDILCFPSNILNKKANFSNNLIRDGAICLTSEHMLIEYLITFA